MRPDLAERAGEPGFSGKTIGDLVAAQGRATADTLARNGRPTRRIHLETLDERALGELLMHFMLETILPATRSASIRSTSRPSRKARCWPSGISRARAADRRQAGSRPHIRAAAS